MVGNLEDIGNAEVQLYPLKEDYNKLLYVRKSDNTNQSAALE